MARAAKAKAPHDSDLWDQSIIAGAVSWTAFQYRGPRARMKIEAATRAQAVAEGGKLASEFARPVLIYAVNGKGRQAVAETIQPRS